LSSFKLLYATLISRNLSIFNQHIVQKLCNSLRGDREVEILDRIYNEFSRGIGQELNTDNLGSFIGYSGAFVRISAAKTHARIITFREHGNKYRCESSDLCFIVDYKLCKPSQELLLSRAITFVQAKLGEQDKHWELQKNQLYFMRYWPPFFYGGEEYYLGIFRAYPDVGSFYLFIYRNKSDSFALSTQMVEHSLEHPIAPGPSGDCEHVKDSSLRTLRNRKDCAYFLWGILFQDLGLYSVDAEKFIRHLYPGLFDPDPPEEAEGRSSVGIRIVVGLKIEESRSFERRSI